VGGRVEQALALKAEYVFGQVVDEIVGAEDGLVAAKDVVRGGMKGKWRCSQRYLEPRELGTAMAWVAMKISKRAESCCSTS